MRMMTGAMQSTPISAMETHRFAACRRQTRNQSTTHAAKLKRLQDHSMHEHMKPQTRGGGGGGLKRSTFIQHNRIPERRNPELLDQMAEPIPSFKTIPSWKRWQLPRMCTKVPGVADRGCQPEPERKSLTLEYVDIKYPEDQWTHAYTDSSAAEATRDWGGGVYIRYSNGKVLSPQPQKNIRRTLKQKPKLSKEPQSRWETSYNQAQCGHPHRYSLCHQQTPKSLPEGSQRGGNCPGRPCSPDKPNPAVDSSTLRDQRKWTSRQTCSGRRPAGPRGQIHLLLRWKDHHQNPNQAATPKLQPVRQPPQTEQTREQVMRFRLRTGHNRPNSHTYSKFKVGESEMCPCSIGIMTAEHLLQHCQLHILMLWGGTCGQNRNFWGTSSIANWRRWRG